MSNQVTVLDEGVLKEAGDGLRQTIELFLQIGMSKALIAQMFRAAADELDPKIIVPGNEYLH